MLAKEIICQVTEKKWLTPTVVGLRFSPSRRFRYEPGQFLSMVIPTGDASMKGVKRAYSFSSPVEHDGYGLCVKIVPGGVGSRFVAQLRVGDTFRAYAPYGEFVYEPKSGHAVCFISTGTGVAPFRAVALSGAFRENPPTRAVSIFGARSADEIIYPGLFESLGFESVVALSRPVAGWKGFTGRVTDYLRTLPSHWGWHSTDFYICGNGDMAKEALQILKGHGVKDESIHLEVYFTPKAEAGAEEEAPGIRQVA